MLVLSEPWLQKVHVRFESDTKAHQTKEVVQNKKKQKQNKTTRKNRGEKQRQTNNKSVFEKHFSQMCSFKPLHNQNKNEQ